MIPPEELEVTLADAPTPGGMHVGMPSGVTVKHKPSGLVATCTAERSQHRNRAVAIEMLEWGLAVLNWKTP